jgi:hypothetical protein
MGSKAAIVSAIDVKIANTKFNIWRIGLTHDLAERKAYWSMTKGQNVSYWSAWTADSLKDAQDIESYFINKGMQGGTGGDLSPQKTPYVYVF